jgi:putative peptidoglycan binding protein
MPILNASAVQFDQALLDDAYVYTSILEAPADYTDAKEFQTDGDDALLGHGTDPGTALPRLIAGVPETAPPPRATRVVVFPRTVKQGMKGYDVLAIKRAISRAGFRKWGYAYTPSFGAVLTKQLKSFQRKNKLTADGVYGPKTHVAMKKWYDGYGARLMLREQKVLAQQKQNDPRKLVVIGATWGYNHRWLIHYTQGPSRMYGVRNHVHIPGIPYYEDCSSFATWCYYQAGLPDPNGLGYNGQGYTGTLGNHGRWTSVAKPGDLCLYGWAPYHHVTVAISSSMCISHGSEIGPLLLPIHYRGDMSTLRSYIS